MARIISRPLDRARPLWELYVIEGHESGLVAMLTKIHHAVIDGLSRRGDHGAAARPHARGARGPAADDDDLADPSPTGLQMLGLGLLGLPRYPLRMLRALPKAIPNLEDTPFGVFPGTGTLSRWPACCAATASTRPDLIAPEDDLQRAHLAAPALRLRPARRSTTSRRPRTTHGATVNDVVVSVCAGAVRRWLLEHDDLPDAPLVAQVPVSRAHRRAVRHLRQPDPADGRAAVHGRAGPGRAAAQTHEALAEMKERHGALPAELLQDANNFIPPAVFARAARLTFGVLDLAARAGRPGTSSSPTCPARSSRSTWRARGWRRTTRCR